MELTQVLIVAFGGTITALAVAGFLGRSLIAQLLAREMELLRSRLKVEADTLAREDTRRFERDQVMRRYRGPLLHAAYDLQSRLYNIHKQQFFAAYYVNGSTQQQHYAVYNTAFLMAQFFGWTEIIRQEVQFIELSEGDGTQRLSEIRDEISRLWQTDELLDDPLMIWAGEQRGIGELMIEPRGALFTCKGYASFLRTFATDPDPLIARLVQAVQASASQVHARHDRIVEVQRQLINMINLLDPPHLYFPATSRTKL